MNWEEAVKRVSPYLFKLETPTCSGTGFLCAHNDDKSVCGIATALHVIDEAYGWRQPIRLMHHSTSEEIFLNESDYEIIPDYEADSAVIIFQRPTFGLPNELIDLIPTATPLSAGKEVGWLGFPAIEPYKICFFSGHISAWQDRTREYLIDGVAINGVSGCPVICLSSTHNVQIVGIVTAYKPNHSCGDALPGLLYAQDASHFQGVIDHIRSIDDADEKEEENQAATERKETRSTTVTSPGHSVAVDGGEENERN